MIVTIVTVDAGNPAVRCRVVIGLVSGMLVRLLRLQPRLTRSVTRERLLTLCMMLTRLLILVLQTCLLYSGLGGMTLRLVYLLVMVT